VEVPLTNAGRRYFADRAAARDLAAFVRARRVQMIRKEAPGAMGHDLESVYGALLARHGIRFTLTRTGVVFEKSSDTGKRFRVVVRRGRIARQNLSPYAFVF
jgi:HJR/Mrr/RecB family endonuclease